LQQVVILFQAVVISICMTIMQYRESPRPSFIPPLHNSFLQRFFGGFHSVFISINASSFHFIAVHSFFFIKILTPFRFSLVSD